MQLTPGVLRAVRYSGTVPAEMIWDLEALIEQAVVPPWAEITAVAVVATFKEVVCVSSGTATGT